MAREGRQCAAVHCAHARRTARAPEHGRIGQGRAGFYQTLAEGVGREFAIRCAVMVEHQHAGADWVGKVAPGAGDGAGCLCHLALGHDGHRLARTAIAHAPAGGLCGVKGFQNVGQLCKPVGHGPRCSAAHHVGGAFLVQRAIGRQGQHLGQAVGHRRCEDGELQGASSWRAGVGFCRARAWCAGLLCSHGGVVF